MRASSSSRGRSGYRVSPSNSSNAAPWLLERNSRRSPQMCAEPFPVKRAVEVLLTHSYHLAHDAKQWRKMQPYPPLGTLYAATALRGGDLSVAIFDPTFVDPIPNFVEALERHRPRILVIY